MMSISCPLSYLNLVSALSFKYLAEKVEVQVFNCLQSLGKWVSSTDKVSIKYW